MVWSAWQHAAARKGGEGLATLPEHHAWPGVAKVWGRQYDEHTKEYPDLFEVDTSKKHREEDFEVTGFGLAPVKSQGGGVSYDSETQGTVSTFTHVTHGLGYICTREEIEDNLYDVVSKRRAAALAFAINQTIENICSNVYNRASNASYMGGDGVELISASHPCSNGNQSNILSTSAQLSEAALEDMLVQIMGATNSKGMKISLMGKSLIVPRQLWFEANRILKSTLQYDTGNNAINAIKATNALPEGIKVNHYLSDANNWFVRTNVPGMTGMKMYWRRKPDFTRDNDFNTENALAKSTMRLSVGWSDFRGLYGSAPA